MWKKIDYITTHGQTFYSADAKPCVSHLGLSLDGVHPADELAVGLEQQQQLKVQFVEPPT